MFGVLGAPVASAAVTLHDGAVKALAVPATSAPAERVFSSARMFTRPHLARLSNCMLSDLVFLKYNSDKL